jgi:hypothetical protein
MSPLITKAMLSRSNFFFSILKKGIPMQTITKAYDTYKKARGAVDALQTAGVPMSEISVLANYQTGEEWGDFEAVEQGTEAGAGAGVGAALGGAAGLLAGLGLMAIPGLGPVVAAGWLASTALGVAAGGATGGIVGSLIDSGVPEEHAHVYSEAVRRGGTLVSVQTEDHDIAKVQAILGNYIPLDPVEQAAAYRRSGWDKFESGAARYGSTRTAAERERRLM